MFNFSHFWDVLLGESEKFEYLLSSLFLRMIIADMLRCMLLLKKKYQIFLHLFHTLKQSVTRDIQEENMWLVFRANVTFLYLHKPSTWNPPALPSPSKPLLGRPHNENPGLPSWPEKIHIHIYMCIYKQKAWFVVIIKNVYCLGIV